MGLLSRLPRRRMKNPVRGTARVIARSEHDGETVWDYCVMQLVVEAPELPARSMDWSGTVHGKRWPATGMTLPVVIDRADPTRVEIEWKKVESNREGARRRAEEVAGSMRAKARDSASAAGPGGGRIRRMGLLKKLFRGGMKDPARGTALVVFSSAYSGRGLYQTCLMELVVEAPDLLPTAVEWSGLVHNARWPARGTTLPVVVDRANPARLEVDWSGVEPTVDQARRKAEEVAAAMRAKADESIASWEREGE